ncbi:hypothetical protein [Streptomyces melanogenes]|uniref:Uncharacterized protein n=1 Tax=Streptomyces melanogenes TaxID=67326 RepID=A0ABZ1XDG7_9ACTN|nr:hypothetical protein [Streptomyces melanogenes]
MATTHLRASDDPMVRQSLLQWADENVQRGQHGSGAVQVHGFTDPLTMRAAVRGAEQFFVNDQMMWLARTMAELPVCAFDADDLPAPAGFLLWSDDPSPDTQTLGRPRAVLWCRMGMTLRILVLDAQVLSARWSRIGYKRAWGQSAGQPRSISGLMGRMSGVVMGRRPARVSTWWVPM